MTFSSDCRAIGYSLATPSRHTSCADRSFESRILGKVLLDGTAWQVTGNPCELKSR
jgi:hypothetical protein